MSDKDPKVGLASCTIAIALSGTAGFTISTAAANEIMKSASFSDKLNAVSRAVDRGELSTFSIDGDTWVPDSRNVITVGDWLQTWEKQGSDNFGKT